MSVVVPIESKRRERAQLIQKIQHVAPSVVLLRDGVVGLQSEAHGFPLALSAAEVVTSGLVIVAFVRMIRAMRRHTFHAEGHHHRVDWVDLFLSAMLATEVLERWHAGGKLWGPKLLLAIVMAVLGLSHGAIVALHRKRRALRVGDEGVSFGQRFFRRFAASWRQIERIDISDRDATVVCRDGRQGRLNLRDIRHPEPVVRALNDARGRLS